jgi:acyl carrier protein
VVVLREDERGEPRIVAYVIPLAGQALSGDELRTYSAERLAEYMIPSAFVLLDALPLTTSGKIDRKALPSPNEELSEPRARYVAPETPTEMALEKIWAEVLRLERVSVHDNFFTLGGHSLLATRLFLRAQRAFGVEVPLRKIFESPTIAGLAQFIEEAVLADIEAMAED